MVVLVVDAGARRRQVDHVTRLVRGADGDRVAQVHVTALGEVLTDDLVQQLTAMLVVSDDEVDQGHRCVRDLRVVSDVPLALITGSERESDEILALTEGCEDYIGARCSAGVLAARVRALLDRGRGGPARALVFGCLRIDPLLRTATVRGRPISLTPIEFDIIEILIENRRRVVPRGEIVERVWGGADMPDHVLDVHLSRLRTKVLSMGGPLMGEPVRGVGYRVGHIACAPGDCRPHGEAEAG
jgi:DNA-binding response OmpR family regulator